MEKVSNILIYAGTILIGYQIMGDMGYLMTIFNSPIALLIRPLFDKIIKLLKLNNKSGKENPKITILTIPLIMLTILLTMLTLIFSPFVLVAMFGKLLIWVNQKLNSLLLKLLQKWREVYFRSVRRSVKGKHTRIKPTDRNLWRIAQNKKVPFIALLGVVVLTVGFILQIK